MSDTKFCVIKNDICLLEKQKTLM